MDKSDESVKELCNDETREHCEKASLVQDHRHGHGSSIFPSLKTAMAIQYTQATIDTAGSALGVGKFTSTETSTFTDITCEQPLRYLVIPE